MEDTSSNLLFFVSLLVIPLATLLMYFHFQKPRADNTPSVEEVEYVPGSIPDGDRIFTPTELLEYNATDPEKPVYIAVKGMVFDVSRRRAMYAPGKGYNVFAGRDASKAMGMMSLKPEDCVPDFSGLDEKQMKILDDWLAYYRKRYPVMGTMRLDESAAKDIDRANQNDEDDLHVADTGSIRQNEADQAAKDEDVGSPASEP